MDAHRWSVVVAHRRFGKTVAVVNHIIRKASQCRQKAPFYAYLAPFYHQAKAIAWGYLKEFTAGFPGRKVNESELWVSIPSPGGEAKIRLFGADNPDALRGLYYDGVVLDEYADMKPEAWDSSIRPALSDRQGWAVFIGTPRGHNAFYGLYQRALREPSWYAASFKASQTGVILPEELGEAKAQMTDAQYRQEYECDFDVSSDDILIPLQLVQSSYDREIGYHSLPAVMGLDVGMSLGGDPSAIVVRQGGVVTHLEEFRLDETLAIAGKVKERFHALQKRPEAIFVDAIGWGAGVAHVLAGWGLPVTAVNVAESASESDRFNKKRDELWWIAREFFAQKQCCIKPHELRDRLAAELSTPTYGYMPSGKIKVEGKDEMKKRGVQSPNLADALCLTMMHDPRHQVTTDYNVLWDDAPAQSRFA